MKLTVKTLKGAKFVIDVDDAHTVEQVKAVIEQEKPELPAAGMKLIHSGKVLKDGDSISGCGIQPNDFLVVMVTKAKKPAAAAAAPAAAAAAKASETPAKDEAKSPAAATSEATEGAAATGTDAAAATAGAAATVSTPAPTAGAVSAPTPVAPARGSSSVPEASSEAVESLMSMGFPEAEVRHCLRAAGNNPDVAIEFLTNGIPDAVVAALEQAASGGAAAAASASSSSPPAAGASQQPSLQSLRNHPQFDNLRRLVQSNPAMLQQVLTQIGQQQPELLEEINSNQALFLEMMNEPVPPPAESSSSSSAPAGGASSSSRGAAAGGGAGGLGFGSPGQMAALISSMGNDELQQMASMMGIGVEQLRQTANLIGSMPEAELNQFMMQAMGGGFGAGMDDDILGGGGGGEGGGGGYGGAQVVRLTEEEMAAVDRLTEMGFDRSDAAQAFLACDKNEAMAANLLMDSMGDGGGFFGGGPGDDDGGNDNNNNDNNQDMDDDADDMYD